MHGIRLIGGFAIGAILLVTMTGCPSVINNVVGASGSIQQAIDQAEAGETITIMGIHDENLKIDKNGLTLTGDENGATIDGDVVVEADNVTIKNIDIDGILDTPGGSFTNLILSSVSLYSQVWNTTVSCAAIVNQGEQLGKSALAVPKGANVCLAPNIGNEEMQLNTVGALTAVNARNVVDFGGSGPPNPGVSILPPASDQGPAPATVDFQASIFEDGTIQSCQWDFDDGTQLSCSTNKNLSPTHEFQDPGEYTVTLAVTNGKGHSSSDEVTITVDDSDSVDLALTNPDFEQDIRSVAGGWTIPPASVDTGDNDEEVSMSTQEAHSGNQSVKLLMEFGGGAIEQKVDVPSELIGETVTYSIWLLMPNKGSRSNKFFTQQLRALDGSGQVIASADQNEVFGPHNSWTKYELSLTIPQGTEDLNLSAHTRNGVGGGSPEPLWVDDAGLTVTSN